MKQVVQPLDGGSPLVVDVPAPVIGPADVLVRTLSTVVSAGTERAVTDLGSSGLLAKARARPDLVRQVVSKARRDGVRATAEAVRSRLASDMPLGYSGCGVVVEVGEHVAGIAIGDLVATGGAGRANHAELQSVPGLLCVPVPEGVEPEQASFATIASVALHALRLAAVEPGAKVVVVGLGLIGQLAARLAVAGGADVAGIDVDANAAERGAAGGFLGLIEAGDATNEQVLRWSRGRGADAVVVAAAGGGSDLLARVTATCRDRATVVVVGDVALELDRRPFYEKELTLKVARSYGPGRYEASYEEWGIDMPAGHVRWTEGRNIEAVLDLLATGRLTVADLVTHQFPIADAPDAYDLVRSRREPYLAVQLSYPGDVDRRAPVVLHAPVAAPVGEPGVGLIGTGAFASTVLLPALAAAGFDRFVAAASASGTSSRRLGERYGFERLEPGPEAVIESPDVDVLVIASSHESHASLAAAALRAGKAVWCEKPLGLTEEELDDVEDAWRASGRPLVVGFNRRWSPAIELLNGHFAAVETPIVVTYRVSAGLPPAEHWYRDRRQGGRLLGEVCHFVDTCEAISGPVEQVQAFSSGSGEALLADDVVLSLRHRSGSLSTISYASGGAPGTPKERIEVLGGGRSAVVDDFRSLTLDRRPAWSGSDKGHRALARAFRTAVVQGEHVARGVSASRAVVAGAASALGRPAGDQPWQD